MPNILPILGYRIKLTYPGIPAFCKRCWKLGHAHFECEDKFKTNWLEYVGDLYLKEKVTQAMLGSWVDALYKYHPTLKLTPINKEQPAIQKEDLRNTLPNNEPEKDDLRLKLQAGRNPPASQTDTQSQKNPPRRGRSSNNKSNKNNPKATAEVDNSNKQEGQSNRGSRGGRGGRGGGGGRGGRGRGASKDQSQPQANKNEHRFGRFNTNR